MEGSAAAMRPRDAAKYLAISETKLRQMVSSGQIQARRAGRCIIIPRAELDSFLNGSAHQQANEWIEAAREFRQA